MRKRSVFKKNGGLKRAMPVHYVPRGGSLTFCGRWAGTVFSNTDEKHVGCKVCLKALSPPKPKRRGGK